ncbi:phytanoyl-CoA dioxygenase [Vibrio ishigakensis]|uniref:Phytanoyl-CoA dioxygenase n=1 Tax=Vibrio ishigakensis TaxID=1481914 RepID=A0A0B8P559_9VIBR|nr:phytanoyl-CoA dioxygenase [Vibrio ishigakensis]GAM70588.1 phytanoyl-CoA dioxygenase [Vibrio sp. JCM 19236]
MDTIEERHLEALGANLPLTPQMIDELETQGFTIIHNVVEKDWLAEMRRTIDMLVEREGDQLAIEHHQEETVTRVANLINKGTVWEKVWAHPTVLAACKHIFGGALRFLA